MDKITYKLWKRLKLPLLSCSGCLAEKCKHRLDFFQAPCISWRKFVDLSKYNQELKYMTPEQRKEFAYIGEKQPPLDNN